MAGDSYVILLCLAYNTLLGFSMTNDLYVQVERPAKAQTQQCREAAFVMIRS